jgi:hypothetical protein
MYLVEGKDKDFIGNAQANALTIDCNGDYRLHDTIASEWNIKS